MLRGVAGAHPDRPAVVSGDAAISYRDLARRMDVLASDLIGRGVRPGDRVGLLLENGPAFVIAYVAALAAGAIVVPLNDGYQQTEIRSFLDECGVSVLIAGRPLEPLCRAAIALAKEPCELLPAEEWTGRAAEEPAMRPAVSIDPRSPVMFQFSSGSTGRPKRIARSHQQVMSELAALVSTLGLGPGDRVLGVAPFSHVNGLTRSMLASLCAGAALYPQARYDRHATAELIERERLTVFIAVPFMFSTLAQTAFRHVPDFSSLRVVVSASAPMPRKFNLLFHEKFGVFVRQLYGSTETGSMTVNMQPDVERTIDSVGTPIDGVIVEVVGEDGRRLGAGETGEIAIASPFAITEYASSEPEHQASFRDGYFFTGDLGRRDADGTLYLVGRKKFFINKGGFKIDPREVEEVLESHALVEEVVVVGVPSPYGDERVKAVIVRRGDCTAADIVTYCRGKIADFKIPSLVEFRESLPRSPTGKIRRAMLT
jgi:long-chain acyl-CoA synthetase